MAEETMTGTTAQGTANLAANPTVEVQAKANDAPARGAEQAENQAKKTAEQQGEKKYTDADIDVIIGKKFAKWQSEKEREVDEAKRLADMNAQQKAEFERDKFKAELAQLRANETRHEMAKTARGMLHDVGIEPDDALLTMLVDADADKTKAAVESFTSLFQAALNKAVIEKVKSPAPKAGVGAVKLTKEQIAAIGDPVARQQAIHDNIDLYT